MRLLHAASIASLLGAGCSSFTVSPTSAPDAGVDAAAPPGSAIGDAGALPDAADGGPIAIDTTKWTSPNGANWSVDGSGGTKITGLTANHPVIVPKDLPDFGSDDYTIYATVKAATEGTYFEFGLVVRLTPDSTQSGFVFGSTYGTSDRPFFGEVSPTDWNPKNVVPGMASQVMPGARYFVTVKAERSTLLGKRWPVGDAEPGWQYTFSSARATGRLAGFYTYYLNDALLESLAYSVP